MATHFVLGVADSYDPIIPSVASLGEASAFLHSTIIGLTMVLAPLIYISSNEGRSSFARLCEAPSRLSDARNIRQGHLCDAYCMQGIWF
jgi:hypothetical protein